jgi:hypothetical protein
MPTPAMMRLAWSICAVGTRAVTRTAGMPALSISFSSTAPQRVPVPHVAVRITPETFAAASSRAIPSPILRAFSIVVATPVVTKNWG